MRSKKKRGLRLLLLLGNLLHFINIITTTRTTILFCQQSCTTFMYSRTWGSLTYTPQCASSNFKHTLIYPIHAYDAPLQGNKRRSIGSGFWPFYRVTLQPTCTWYVTRLQVTRSKYPLSVSTYLSSRNHFEPIIEVKKEIDCIWYVVTLRAEC